MLNKCILFGRLCDDPDYKTPQSGVPLCNFRIAINRQKKQDGSQEADFINCVAWRKTAEFISRYFRKGQLILVEGQLRNNNYTDNNGVKHYQIEVCADSVSFGGDKHDDQEQPAPQQQYQNGAAPAGNMPVQSYPQQYPQGAAPPPQYTQQYQPPRPYPPDYPPPPHFDSVPDYRTYYPGQ